MTRPSRPGVRDCPSPNCETRPAEAAIDTLILHYTGMRSADEARARMCDPAARVSAHYMIEENGKVWRLVDEGLRAWHAGLSWWRGAANLNDRSIGIELVNPGHEFGYRDFPAAQIRALAALCREIRSRHPIPQNRILGHSDIAPLRKQDPGERFPWRELASKGIGLWPAATEGGAEPAFSDSVAALAGIGYDVVGRSAADAVAPDAARLAAVAAFQRRFRPRGVDGVLDGETRRLIATVARLFA